MLKSVILAVIVDKILSKMGVRMKSEGRDIFVKTLAVMSRVFNLI